jgi:hypothetical protein
MDKEIPLTFTFIFPEVGEVQEVDMTRDQLLHVIRYLMREQSSLREDLRDHRARMFNWPIPRGL